MDIKRLIAYLVFIFSILSVGGCMVNDNDEFLRRRLNIEIIGSGTVSLDPDKQTYSFGEEVKLTAREKDGWTFDRWQGMVNKTENPITITVDNSEPIIAVFTNKDAMFTLDIQEIGAGKVDIKPNQATYRNGTEVTLEAIADPGMAFEYWLGDLSENSQNPVTFLMSNDKRILAVFVPEELHGIEFSDPTVEREVRRAINKPTGPITILDTQYLTSLDLSSFWITSLQGMEYLTALNQLTLNQTGTDDITPLATLHRLEYLYLQTNQIQEIDVVSYMLDLIELDLGDNQITDLSPLVWLQGKNLTTLRLGDNNISEISALRFITSLEILELQNNRITEIEPLHQLTSLKELNLSDNQISDITPIVSDISFIETLEVLNLSNNQLTDEIDLTWLEKNGHLRELYLAGNQIRELSDLYWSKNLEILDLSENQIVDMGIFITQTDIQELYLHGNQIRNIANLCNLGSLEILHLHNNDIRDIEVLRGLWSLKEVTLMDNPNLNIIPGFPAWDIIQDLKQRGVNVHY